MSKKTSRRTVLFGLLILVAGFFTRPATLSATSSTAFSGQATVVRATLPLVGTLVLADTEPLPQSGGALRASLLTLAIPNLLGAEVAHATTIGQGNRSRAEASLANFGLTVGGNTIGATFLRSNAMAVCGAGGASTTGSSEIANLVINGQPIVVTGQPNQTIDLPLGGRVIINEQNSRPGDLTVNALHVIVPGVADVIIASAHADITCPSAPPNQCPGSDFVTGGGWILGPSGARANFAVAGGIKNRGLWGHLEYHDHGTGLKVHGTSVTVYTGTGTTRHIEGTADIGGMAGTYSADVTDNGEPGRADIFTLRLSNGYTASDAVQGGNIQLHKPCQ